MLQTPCKGVQTPECQALCNPLCSVPDPVRTLRGSLQCETSPRLVDKLVAATSTREGSSCELGPGPFQLDRPCEPQVRVHSSHSSSLFFDDRRLSRFLLCSTVPQICRRLRQRLARRLWAMSPTSPVWENRSPLTGIGLRSRPLAVWKARRLPPSTVFLAGTFFFSEGFVAAMAAFLRNRAVRQKELRLL